MEVPCDFNAGPIPGQTTQGSLTINSDDPVRPSANLNVKGLAAGPHLRTPSELLNLGSATTGTITLTSDGSAPVQVNRLQLAVGQDFSVTSNPSIPVALAPGNSVKLTVTRTTNAPGMYQDQILVAHNGSQSGKSLILVRAAV
jgi:hypothetical protein